MAGKEIAYEGATSVRIDPKRNLAITSGDLPKTKASSGTSPAEAMAGDRVAEMFGRLRLTSQESNALVLEDEGDDDLGCPEWALIGKVLSPNPFHISTIKSALRAAWGNPKGLELRPMGVNLFLAEFATEADNTRVQDGSPWNVGKHAVILNEFDPTVNIADVRFERLSIWFRILNLSFGLMDDKRGKELAGRVGKVEKMEVDDKGRAWGEFLWVRASINITESLMRCVVSQFSLRRGKQQISTRSCMSISQHTAFLAACWGMLR
jgi:hypothetical protein